MKDSVSLETLKGDLSNFKKQEVENNKKLAELEAQVRQIVATKNAISAGIQTLSAIIKRAEKEVTPPLNEPMVEEVN